MHFSRKMLMPQNSRVTLILKLYCSMAQSYNYPLLLVSVLKLAFSSAVVLSFLKIVSSEKSGKHDML